MGNPIATIIAGALIAVAILVVGRYEATPLVYGGTWATIFRLDRWTGEVVGCAVDPDTMTNPNSFVGAKMICKAK